MSQVPIPYTLAHVHDPRSGCIQIVRSWCWSNRVHWNLHLRWCVPGWVGWLTTTSCGGREHQYRHQTGNEWFHYVDLLKVAGNRSQQVHDTIRHHVPCIPGTARYQGPSSSSWPSCWFRSHMPLMTTDAMVNSKGFDSKDLSKFRLC